MILTAEQVRAVTHGEAVALTVEETPCVLVREDVFDQLTALLEDWDPRTMRKHIAHMMADDWTDPAMSVYDQ